MKTFEQFIKEQLADDIQQHGEEMALATYSFTGYKVIQLVEQWQKLQQTPCSTLRDYIIQQLNSDEKHLPNYRYDFDKHMAIGRINAWKSLLEFMDAPKPVA